LLWRRRAVPRCGLFPSSTQMSDRGGDELEGKEKGKKKRKENNARVFFYCLRVFFVLVCVLISKPDRFETRLIRNPNTNDNRSPVEIAG
jgi:hypothetical protein